MATIGDAIIRLIESVEKGGSPETETVEDTDLHQRVDELENTMEKFAKALEHGSSTAEETVEHDAEETEGYDLTEEAEETLKALDTEEYRSSKELSEELGITGSGVGHRIRTNIPDEFVEVSSKGRRLTEEGARYLGREPRESTEDSGEDDIPEPFFKEISPEDVSMKVRRNSIAEYLKAVQEKEGKFYSETVPELGESVFGTSLMGQHVPGWKAIYNACEEDPRIEKQGKDGTLVKYRFNPRVKKE